MKQWLGMIIRRDEGAPSLTFIFRALSLQQTCFRSLGVKFPPLALKNLYSMLLYFDQDIKTRSKTSPREKTDEKTPHP